MSNPEPVARDTRDDNDQEKSMETAIAAIIAELVKVAARTSVGSVRDRIRAAEATKNDQDVIVAQSEIINELIADKNDLVRLGESLREQFVAQQISGDQLTWLTNKIVPLLEKWTLEGAADKEARKKAEEGFETIRELMDPELLELAQVLGFNYKYAIGEALSELIHQAIVGKRNSPQPSPMATPGGGPAPDGDDVMKMLFGGFGSQGFPGQGPSTF